MPWTVSDVDHFKKGMTPKQKRQWVAIANDALARCMGQDCEASAIKQANGAMQESGTMPETEQLYQRLQEAANCAEWMESRLHLMFTEIADNLFGEGYLSRDERIALSGAIGDALDSFRAVVEAKASQLYQRSRWKMPDDAKTPDGMQHMEEAGDLSSDFVPLLEKAVRRDGTIPIKVIAPGWGASGYYPAEVLERDGPRLFASGIQMFWDHQTATEEAERPEGSLENLAAVLTAPARWDANGAAGPGLYADAKVFETYRQSVDSLAPHIGVSIRASGRAVQGAAEGRSGQIVQSIASVKSIDFVTKPGAGGQIISMFEAARPSRQDSEEQKMNEHQQQELKEAQDKAAELTAQNARLQEALILRDAKDFVSAALAKSTLPEVTRQRLAESLSANPPVANGALDKAAYTTRIAEALQAETAYLQQVAGYGAGRIEGMGNTATTNHDLSGEALTKRMAESFRALGLSEKEATIAAAGRLR